jgi:RNA polymerase-interacting CarD/CdnL/TRCF family regulator
VLPACQSTATAASHTPHHRAAQATVQQTENGLTFTDLKDLANVKRDLQIRTQQMQRGMTFEDLQDLAKVKRDLFRR